MALDPRLTAGLVCPVCKGTLVADEDKHMLVCPRCALGFAVQNNIPNMLAVEATKLTDDEAAYYNEKLSKVIGG